MDFANFRSMKQEQYKKVILNNSYGGFSLSKLAFERLKELGNSYAVNAKESEISCSKNYYLDIPRDDQQLVQVVEELKHLAAGDCCTLGIAKIPTVMFEIEEYDGLEQVVGRSGSWRATITFYNDDQDDT
jgi:hypothetical protein